jgi:hypothetical protein
LKWRQERLPTKLNILKVSKKKGKKQTLTGPEGVNSSLLSDGDIVLTEDIDDAISKVEHHTGVSLKSILSSIAINHEVKFLVSNICLTLRSNPYKVPLKLVIDLISLLDPEMCLELKVIDIIKLLSDYDMKNRKPITYDLELTYICKTVLLSGKESV